MTNEVDERDVETRLLDERQVAERLRLSVRTLRMWRVLGRGPAFLKLGRAVRYAVPDLQAYEAASRRRGTQGQSAAGASGAAS